MSSNCGRKTCHERQDNHGRAAVSRGRVRLGGSVPIAVAPEGDRSGCYFHAACGTWRCRCPGRFADLAEARGRSGLTAKRPTRIWFILATWPRRLPTPRVPGPETAGTLGRRARLGSDALMPIVSVSGHMVYEHHAQQVHPGSILNRVGSVAPCSPRATLAPCRRPWQPDPALLIFCGVSLGNLHRPVAAPSAGRRFAIPRSVASWYRELHWSSWVPARSPVTAEHPRRRHRCHHPLELGY